MPTPEMLRHMLLDFQQMKSYVQDPLVMARAEDIYYWDVNGKRYIDGISGIFTVNVGHANPRVRAALHRQIDTLCFAPPLHATNVPAVELANLLTTITPGDLNTVKLLSGGSEATEVAMKMARQYHRQTGNPLKYKVVSLYSGYHGATMGALSATGLPKRKAIFEPTLTGFVKAMPPSCHACPFNLTYPSCGITCVEQIDRIIEMEGPETVAAVIVEPISNTGGITTPPHEYLPRLREICDRHNVLLIFDEIITGFGRTGQMFAAADLRRAARYHVHGQGHGLGLRAAGRDRRARPRGGRLLGRGRRRHGVLARPHLRRQSALQRRRRGRDHRDSGTRPLRQRAAHGRLPARARLAEFSDLNMIADVRGKGLLVGIGLARDAGARA